MSQSRTGNAVKNIFFSLLSQMINVVLKFGMRTVFIYCLGKEYLGINGTFSNVLSLLSLTELGLGTAIVYSMYKPIAEHDTRKIIQFVQYYKKIYTAIGLIIIVLGICLIPFLDLLITDLPNVKHIQFIYVLFLLQSSTSYFFAQYVSLIDACQMGYEYRKINMVFSILKSVIQSAFLLITHMYIVYLILDICIGIASNYMIYKKAVQLFPYIVETEEQLQKSDKTELWKNALSNFSIKIGNTIINCTDNLIISACISTILVGVYSNYMLIIQIILTTTVMVQQSLMAGIGNVCVTESEENKERIYHRVLFLYGAIYCVVTASLFNLLQPFVSIWLGKDYMLDNTVVYVIIANCYLSGMHQVNEAFIYADGLYQHFKWKPWAEAVMNLVVSIILAYRIGIFGVLIGTTISHFAFTFWYDAFMVYKYSLHEHLRDYFVRYLFYAGTCVFVICLNRWISIFTGWGDCITRNFSGITIFLIKAIVAVTLSVGVWALIFWKTDEYRYYMMLCKK